MVPRERKGQSVCLSLSKRMSTHCRWQTVYVLDTVFYKKRDTIFGAKENANWESTSTLPINWALRLIKVSIIE